MKKAICASLSLALLSLGVQAHAATIVVTPANVAAGPTLNQWYRDNYRDTSTGYTSHTTAVINSAKPHDGNGSVQMSLTDASGKADYAYYWGFVQGRNLGNLNALSYDWYRDGSSTAPGHLQPALRIAYDADGDAATTADRGYLIWEQVYNGTTLTDQWVHSDTMSGNFWQRQLSPGVTIENYDTTLTEWINGPRPAGSDPLNANSAVIGIEFGIGSGWGGTFNGFVDDVSFGFVGEGATTFNFEAAAAAVPEPGSLALLGIGMLGALTMRRRRG